MKILENFHPLQNSFSCISFYCQWFIIPKRFSHCHQFTLCSISSYPYPYIHSKSDSHSVLSCCTSLSLISSYYCWNNPLRSFSFKLIANIEGFSWNFYENMRRKLKLLRKDNYVYYDPCMPTCKHPSSLFFDYKTSSTSCLNNFNPITSASFP